MEINKKILQEIGKQIKDYKHPVLIVDEKDLHKVKGKVNYQTLIIDNIAGRVEEEEGSSETDKGE